MNFGNTTKTLLSGALALVLIFSPVTVGAQSGGGALPFQVRDIRVEGLQRIPVERVYAELPIQPGDTVNRNDVVQAVKRLFATGDYEDVQLGRDGDELVVVVAERPSIARIDLDGNKQIEEEDLRQGLTQAGLAEGEVSNERKFKNNGEPMEHGTKFGHKWYKTDAYCNGKYIDFAGTSKTQAAMEKGKL
mgnify:CR=1 FL=1